jgi:hypothetical protein
MYENAGTYRKFEGFAENRMLMRIKDLSNWGGTGAEKRGN